MKNGGHLVPEGDFQREILELVQKHIAARSRTTRLYVEGGVYKMYLRLDATPMVKPVAMNSEEDVRLCPMDEAMDGGVGPEAGFPRHSKM